MKILISSHYFYPSVGGGETNAEILAREFVNLGHSVKVVTHTPGNNLDSSGEPFPFSIIRVPSSLQLIKLVNWCDVYLQNGISIRAAWPLLFIKKKWVIRHLTWIKHGNSVNILKKIKLSLLRFANSISISQAISKSLPVSSTVIPNPYRDHLFQLMPNKKREKELVFLGRLVSDKGLRVLLEALILLKKQGVNPNLTVIGSGPEEEPLKKFAVSNELSKVTFIGQKIGSDLVSILNEHQIMVVPSLWQEPFGVVALEGIGCGCVIIGSEKGGLKDAIGPCGITFPNGDSEKLAEIILNILNDPGLLKNYQQKAEDHLKKHKQGVVAQNYIKVFNRTLQ